MFKRPQYIAVGLVVMLMLTIALLPARTTARLKLAISGLFLPLFGLAGTAQHATEKAGTLLTSRGELARQNQVLREENDKLRTQSLQNAELLRENARLHEQLNWRQLQRGWTFKPANVIARDPASWWRTIQIDLGSRDGMKTNLTVLTTTGLVGRISTVGYDRSQVLLVGDTDCRVAAVVDETRDMGVVGQAGPFDGSLVTMNYLPKEANLKAGQTVVTSGLGGVFPKGIPIGRIVDSRPVEYGLYTEARIKLAANLSALEDVWVLMP
ncbi:MAG: rod shape-determining protein MreC [Verrucomicrobiota bacterium]